jgi:H+-transporting ATPase
MAEPQLSLEQQLQQLHTDGEGLSGNEAAERLQRVGPNALPEKKKSKLAMLLSAVVGDWLDFSIIMALLVGNTAIAYLEESSAGDAVAALKAKLALETQVKRGHGDLLYSGSVLKQGFAEGVVVGTGVNTFFGKTAQLVREAESNDHLRQAVVKLSDYLILINIVLVSLILVVRIHLGDNALRVIKFCLVLTVASIPLATPTVLAVTMAIGAQALAKKGALVTLHAHHLLHMGAWAVL